VHRPWRGLRVSTISSPLARAHRSESQEKEEEGEGEGKYPLKIVAFCQLIWAIDTKTEEKGRGKRKEEP